MVCGLAYGGSIALLALDRAGWIRGLLIAVFIMQNTVLWAVTVKWQKTWWGLTSEELFIGAGIGIGGVLCLV
jgi:hypothetical protein